MLGGAGGEGEDVERGLIVSVRIGGGALAEEGGEGRGKRPQSPGGTKRKVKTLKLIVSSGKKSIWGWLRKKRVLPGGKGKNEK